MAFANARVLYYLSFLGLALALSSPCRALSIELKDVAADRIDRQRAAAAGALPLPGTPNVAILGDRLKEQNVTLANPILIRVFKAESELEIWKERNGSYFLFATYPVCHWSGTVGPKLKAGDKQAPEGFYTVTRTQIRRTGRWPKSLNLGFPNVFDQSLARTGSDILIHGGCSSIGCFAMTNPVMEEIYQLTQSAIAAGETYVPVHVFPFRMTEANMKAQGQSPWKAFWDNIKLGHDAFLSTLRPPSISICDGKYEFADAPVGSRPGPLSVCPQMLSTVRDENRWLSDVPLPSEQPVTPKSAEPAQPEIQNPIGNDKSTALEPPQAPINRTRQRS